MKKNILVKVLSLFTLVSLALGFNKDNLKEIRLSSLKNRRSLSTNTCENDTRILDENTSLTRHFQRILSNFTDSISDHFDSFCKLSKNGEHVSTECVIDYSLFSAAHSYQSLCDTEGGAEYPMSFLMHCFRQVGTGTATLEMDLMNIPRCVGISCDAGHLYSTTMLQVINEIQVSFGSDDSWECRYFHDFVALQSAPGRTIELPTNAPIKQPPEDTDDTEGTEDEKENGKGQSAGVAINQQTNFYSTVALVAGSLTLLFH